MACLRESPPDGRVGVVSCDEKGCLYRLVTLNHDPLFAEHTSEADCVLQLRLRAGVVEEFGEDINAGSPYAKCPRCGRRDCLGDLCGLREIKYSDWEEPIREGLKPPWGQRRLKRGEIENLLNQKLTDWQWARISDLVWFRAGDAPGESLGVDTNEVRSRGDVENISYSDLDPESSTFTEEFDEINRNEVRFLGDASSPYRRSGGNELGEFPPGGQLRRDGVYTFYNQGQPMGLPAESGGDEGERVAVTIEEIGKYFELEWGPMRFDDEEYDIDTNTITYRVTQTARLRPRKLEGDM